MAGLGLDSGDVDLVTLYDGTVLQIHGPRKCSGQACCFHAPSDHPLREAPMIWLRSLNLMMRKCEHGLIHPDPDSLAHVWSRMSTFDGWHPCCAEQCCMANSERL